MDSIKVGDRVTWRREREHIWEVLRLKDDLALIAPINLFRSVWVPLDDITRVDDMNTPVASSAQQSDEFANALPVHPEPFRVLGSMTGLVEDYDFAIGLAGDLGGAEL